MSRTRRDLLLIVAVALGVIVLALGWGVLCGALGWGSLVSFFGGALIGVPAGPVIAVLVLDLYDARTTR